MKEFLRKHPALKWTIVSIAGVLAVLAILLALVDWNMLRGPLERMISAKAGHPTSIGHLSARIWSWEPTFTVEDLSIQNPEWAERRTMLRVKRITVQVSLGRLLLGQLVLPRVELIGPAVDLERKQPDLANWSAQPGPSKPATASPHLPAVRRLIISDGKIRVADRVRKLSFDGTLVASEHEKTKDDAALQLRCKGSLNERPFELRAHGGPLVDIDPNKPYDLSAEITAADISLQVQATIPKPFDLAAYRAKFELGGADLADAYYLTGLALPNTAKYRLRGTLRHDGDRFQIDDFQGTVGSSNLSGTLSVTVGGDRPQLAADLASTRLDIADLAPTLGTRLPAKQSLSAAAASKVTPAASKAATGASSARPAAATSTAAASQWLLPDADLQVSRVRGMDADVKFKAESVLSSKVPLEHLQFHLMLNDGVLRLDPLSFQLPQGQFAGTVRIDATTAIPESDIDMTLRNINLAQFKGASAKDPPLEGILMGRIKLHGAGQSVHKFASDADGSVSVVVPHGEMRAVFAELMGINVARSLGLLLTKDQQQSELRCGVAAFQAQQGQLNAKIIVMDTTNVLITGQGGINLRTEQLDLTLQGHTKKLSLLHLQTPIKLEGTLAKPKVGVEAKKTLLQVGAGTLLATLLTPVAAVLAFIDPGLAKNADCASLKAQGGAAVRPSR